MLARAGHRVAATGWLRATSAAELDAFLAAAEVENEYVRLAGPASVPSADERGALVERVLALASTAPSGRPGWFVLSGSLPAGVDSGFYCELATLVSAAGARVLVNAGGEPFRRALKSEPHVLMTSVRELESLARAALPSREAIVAAARGVMKGETELVAVSLAPDGALFVEEDRAVWTAWPARAARATATTDSRALARADEPLAAGIIAAKLRKLELAELARLASGFVLEAETARPAAEWGREIRAEEA